MVKKIKVGVSGWYLGMPFVGIGKYSLGLIEGLTENGVFVVVPCLEKDYLAIKNRFKGNAKIKIVLVKGKFEGAIGKILFECWGQKKVWENEQVLIAHSFYPAVLNPLSLRKKGILSVVTIHDVIPLEDKRYSKKFKSKMLNWLTYQLAKKFDLIVAVSEVSARKFKNWSRVLEDKVLVCENGVSNLYFKKIDKEENGGRKYLLYVGGFDIRKNFSRVLEVFQKVLKNEDLDLIIVGEPSGDVKLNQSFVDGLKVNKLEKRIKFVGKLSEFALIRYFRGSESIISLSENEGFNLPLIEAIVCGTKVICSDVEVHREVLRKVPDEKVLFIDLTKKDLEIAKEINIFLKKKVIVESKIESFSWSKKAKKLVEIYKKLLNFNLVKPRN